ncbi:hypothetical protein [Amycolatopsis magusensis]|uniref:YCII-related domain-containing protein n=1 Tax=Amycolatopsis magusensis TaxID=882444 RepID=A0ABS4Q2K7_9PSEU|nr:hypothetical protein [Amycolatopsis magusensis]MBP2185304.1 hypothetical protein [Amycolatopsis magusensis]MDI5978821.1 hypothetical protein [Amycolatopsis magusensis]UJW28600.1 hypothetical protein L3Q67_25360 [Saccharothrix sp. AJ9571]
MFDHLSVSAPGAVFTARLLPITGDRLIHPADRQNELGRIVLRWGRQWIAQTWAAGEHFRILGAGSGEPPRYEDKHVRGWLFLRPEIGSLAEKVRTGEIDVATALCVEAEAWPEFAGPGARR